MTLKIEITVPSDQVIGGASDYIEHALNSLGFSRANGPIPHPGECPRPAAPGPYTAKEVVEKLMPYADALLAHNIDQETRAEQAVSVLDEPSVQAAVAKRERGQPSPGKARRTKAEIAEDEAAAAADFIPEAQRLAEEGRQQFEAERQAISTGGERIDPEADAQDAADEAAETAANETGAPSLNDLRRLMGDVQRKHGMATATRIPFLLGKPIAEITDAELPEAIAKIQTLLDGDTPAAAQAVTAATVAAGAEPAPAATKQDVLAAMYDYADFADGTRDQSKMKWTMVDVPVVFQKLFGVQKLTEVPVEGYGQAVAGIREMLAKDPFKRARG